ncbi:DUF294 nucleotidyltransferase-like domain-containing protein [Alkalilimnicola ehrlichii MLHE-1]|uniref:CBS domain-containing protein n=1 Tax=Alkalilimnicola ehrlichii (strain ATCC BAA-1101 / DSM 17681 / MLHE-1) TaxID=187272 RepID=Q0A740_ALKEH|nr:DUF294 nucleotidyltransferase-like domain-containing protein [Alkalilimnicola ehrlichii]ABI57347.1 protein of unknown function DUF294, nucleotidyltransferase putative [Alkalilimnicola ehrlichii MLHE-1]
MPDVTQSPRNGDHRCAPEPERQLIAVRLEAARRPRGAGDPTQITAAQQRLVAQLRARGLPAGRIQRRLTTLNNTVIRRLARQAVAVALRRGAGPPPVRFCLLVMGSGARDEHFLGPDQDHGMVLADYPDRDHDAVDAWFRCYSSHLVERLEAAGFPRDTGDVMCTNPLWRKTLGQWTQQITTWARRADTVSLCLADVLLDCRPLFGAPALARALRTALTRQLATAAFLKATVMAHGDRGVGLGWFNRFVTMGRSDPHRGCINLKHTALLPFITAARQLALYHRVPALSTRGRLRGLHRRGALTEADHQALQTAMDTLADQVLRHQLRQLHEGQTADYFLDPTALPAEERQALKEALKRIRRLRDQARNDITGQIF